MNIKVLQNKLKEGLNIISRASIKSTTLPILKNILIKGEDNFLSLSSTDLEIGVKWWTLAKVEKKGEITVPFGVFSNFINLLPNERVDMNLKGSVLSVQCKDYNIKINGINAKEYPIIPKITKKDSVVLSGKSFCEGLSQIIDIPSLSKVKPEISGVLLIFTKEGIKMVATDSYRLAEKNIGIQNKVNNLSFIIPQKTAREVVNIFKELDEDMEIVFGDNQILFKVDMREAEQPYIELTSKLIEGEYPDYKSIIPSEFKSQIILDKDEFLNKIKAASVFSGKVNEVNLDVDTEKEEITIKSQATDLGDYKAKIKGRAEGEKTNISFNYRFLLDGLLNIKSSEVIFEISGESSPGVLKPVGKSDFLYVVMPIKG